MIQNKEPNLPKIHRISNSKIKKKIMKMLRSLFFLIYWRKKIFKFEITKYFMVKIFQYTTSTVANTSTSCFIFLVEGLAIGKRGSSHLCDGNFL